MNRVHMSEREFKFEKNASGGGSGARELSACSRREFLANSTGLAVAGAIGALGGTHTLSARELTARVSPSNSSVRALASGKPRRIIIDTDPGIDDAMAIFLALRSPELKVEAITPVCGNVPRLVEIAGRTDIPVAAGASHPLVRRLITSGPVHGVNGLAGVDFPEPKIKPVHETAPGNIRRSG